jgi:signal transduction histidine kinase
MKAQKKLIAAQARAEFFTDLMSHDINNLHQGIMIGLELLLTNEDFPYQFREQVQSALDHVERSVSLISNVRRFSRISESPTKPMDIRQALEHSKVTITNSFPLKNIKINLDAKHEYCTVVGNEFIFDLFYNILHNSAKFDPKDDVVINIQVGPSEDDGIVEIKITDYGPGIPNGRKETILTRFKDRETKGSGLGLAIVQQIVDQYDGKIWIEDRIKDEPKSGTSFIIHLHRA